MNSELIKAIQEVRRVSYECYVYLDDSLGAMKDNKDEWTEIDYVMCPIWVEFDRALRAAGLWDDSMKDK